MRLLLDTHVLLWSATSPKRLGRLEPAIRNPDNELIVSVVSGWEIAIKSALGRLVLPESAVTYVPAVIGRMGATVLPLSLTHALSVAELPMHHADPFDRLLIAIAQDLAVPLLSADSQMEDYDIDLRRP